MTDQTPTNTPTRLTGDEIETLVYEAGPDANIYALTDHVARIKADAYAAGLAAREAHANTLRDRVTALVEESEKAAEAMRQSREMWPTTSQEWSDLNSLSLRLDAEARRYRAALDAAPAPTDNQHNNELADRVKALADKWDARAEKCRSAAHRPTVTLGAQHAYLQDAGTYTDAARALRAVVDGPTTPTQETP